MISSLHIAGAFAQHVRMGKLEIIQSRNEYILESWVAFSVFAVLAYIICLSSFTCLAFLSLFDGRMDGRPYKAFRGGRISHR
jgi:hypothetical protein